MSEANLESERSERIQILGRVYRLGSIYRNPVSAFQGVETGKSMTGEHWGAQRGSELRMK